MDTEVERMVSEQVAAARQAFRVVATASTAAKNAALLAMSRLLEEEVVAIEAANRKDLETARQEGLAPPLVNRLRFDREKIAARARALEVIAALPDPVGSLDWGERRPTGLEVQRVRVPLGVLAVIYEARPHVTVNAGALGLKAGNTVLLKGGSEARGTNLVLASLWEKALAEQAWEWWLPDSPRVGQTTRPFTDLEDYAVHLASYRPVYIVRDDRYLGLVGYPSFASYWQEGAGARAVDAEGEPVTVVPAVEDWELHQTFCWHDARLSAYGTLENRVNCEQPPKEIMVAAALTLGIMENLGEASRLAAEYAWEELVRARQEAICQGMEATLAGRAITEFCRAMLEVAGEGLRSRGLGEETFLEPLWERLERKECPADRVREVVASQGIAGLMEKFSWAPYKRS